MTYDFHYSRLVVTVAVSTMHIFGINDVSATFSVHTATLTAGLDFQYRVLLYSTHCSKTHNLGLGAWDRQTNRQTNGRTDRRVATSLNANQFGGADITM